MTANSSPGPRTICFRQQLKSPSEFIKNVSESLFIPNTARSLQPDYPRAGNWLLDPMQVVVKTTMPEICFAGNCSMHIPALRSDRCIVEGI